MVLDDICEMIVDCEHKTAPTQESGYPSIRTPNIAKGYFILDNVNRVSDETYRLWTRRVIPRAGDLIMAREAPVGNVAMITHGIQPCLGQRTLLIRCDTCTVIPRYLVYHLIAPEAQAKIHSLTNGATVPHLNMEDVRNLSLPEFPDLKIQRKIAAILSAYDDLIENNQRRIKILEVMAQNLYREWFVKFRFPGYEQVRFVDSPLGRIPEGWEVMILADIANVNHTQINAHSAPERIHYIDISSVSPGQIDSLTTYAFSEAPSRARRIVKHGDVLWSCVRPNRRSFARVMHPEANTIASTGFAVLTAIKVSFAFLYYCLTTDDFVSYLANNATGVAYPAVSTGIFEKAEIIVPPILLVMKFDEIIIPMLEQIHTLRCKIQICRRTRDLLLPKLISGEVDVSELDIAIPEEALP